MRPPPPSRGGCFCGGGGGGGGSGGASPLPRPAAPAAPRRPHARDPSLITPEEGEGGTFSQHPSTSLDPSTPAALPRVAGGAGCTDEQVCAYFQTSVDGVTSFDNIGWSFIVIMQAVTLDTWLAPSYAAMATVTPYAWAYFFVLAMVGGFFVVNLFLAVIFASSSRRRR